MRSEVTRAAAALRGLRPVCAAMLARVMLAKVMMAGVMLAGVMLAGGAVAQQAAAQGGSAGEAGSTCFVDNLPLPGQSQDYETRIRLLMMALVPVEYRNSCGLIGEAERRYYQAVRATVNCQGSEGYDKFFGRYLGDLDQYLFAARPEELRSDEDRSAYCAIVGRIDLNAAVTPDGKVDQAALQLQGPLFQALQELVARSRVAEDEATR